jgi:hypothetical protein
MNSNTGFFRGCPGKSTVNGDDYRTKGDEGAMKYRFAVAVNFP